MSLRDDHPAGGKGVSVMEDDGGRRTRSRVEVYMHFVWTVKYRISRLTPTYERPVHHTLSAKAEQIGCDVIAVGGLPDHVHMLVRMPGKLSPSDFVRTVKIAATATFNDLRPDGTEPFHWQDGYGCFSLWRTQIENVTAYVREQKERHAQNRLWDALEQFEETEPQPGSLVTK